MSTESISTQNESSNVEAGFISRGFAMTYALFSYSVGAGALFWFFFAALGFAPYSLSTIKVENTAGALAMDFFLIFLFAVQHTIMARKSFKQQWNKVLPAHLERASFVLLAGLIMASIMWFWQTVPGTVWSIENEVARGALLCLAIIGIVYVLLTSLVTNHFELFGLRQAWLYTTRKPYTPLEFKRHWVYKYSRHPMMLGLLIVIWSTADMSMTRLVLALLFSIYLFIGIQFEERGLILEFGDKYRQYKKEVGLFFTFRKADV